MKKIICLFTIIFCISQFAFAQAKSVFFELGGPGLASMNFDTRFTKSEGGIGGRVGIGYFNIDDEQLLTIPIGINYLLSKNQRNYFEIGGGITIVNYNSDYIYSDDDTFTGTFGHLNFGYRLQPKEGGFMFRAAITPVFGKGGFIPYYGGVSFGYKF
ncbi:MAG: hypothetical protein JWR72_859 [Flavisolibacter sp.]|jgi:hypothetical protein|nr:hypothetical protein [Flavisolibacter sp.]